MADFVAQMVLNDVTGGASFQGQDQMRIFNNTGFGLTNEVHDDGESYGGAMNDLLVEAMRLDGKRGLVKVTDLTLETMRLTRNNPELTANGWFDHMLFSDDLGNEPIRHSGELKDLIFKALAGRNFNLNGAPTAVYTLRNGKDELTAVGPGSRPRPINVNLKETETASYELSVNLKSTETYSFKYPVTVKVQLRGDPFRGRFTGWARRINRFFIRSTLRPIR